MKILHTVEYYDPHVGGAELVVKQVSERLARRGHQVTVATTKLPSRRFRELNGVGVEQFDVGGAHWCGVVGTETSRYVEFVRDFGADVTMHYGCVQWTTGLALETVVTERHRRAHVFAPCGWPASSEGWPLQVRKNVEAYFRALVRVAPLFDAIVHHSTMNPDRSAVSALGLDSGIVIPNGVDLADFQAEPALDFRTRHGIRTAHMVLCVANFFPGKGQEHVIRALLELGRRDLTAVFIGADKGRMRPCMELARGLESVMFLDRAERAETVAAFRAADLFAFGSESEVFPLVLLEAMASSTPFVTTDVGNARELRGGVVCSRAALPTEIGRLLDDPAERRRLASEGLRDVRASYDWEGVTDRYEALYSRVVEARRVRAS